MTATSQRPSTMSTARVVALGYGFVVYAAFLVVFLCAIGFVDNLYLTVAGSDLLPRTIDSGGPETSTGTAIVVDVVLLTVFATQHSVMARVGFKRWWTRLVPEPIERSTFVLFATAALAALLWWWHPVTHTVWDVSGDGVRLALTAVSLAGWALVLTSTFLINHFDLFGLRQVVANARGRTMPAYRFVTPLWYGLVRHPIYLGYLVAFWVAPTMTVGHLVFALATTGYILIGIQLEERDLVDAFGEEYRSYRRRVPMLLPGARRRG